MAKKSSVEKNNRRRKLVAQYAAKRAELKAKALNEDLPLEDRFAAASRWPSCRATRRRTGSATAARSRAVRAVSIANLKCPASRCASTGPTG